MKLYKLFKFLLALSFLLTASINMSLAAGTFETCPGIARNLSWSSSNASTNPGSCYGVTSGVNSNDCRFDPVPNIGGNRSVTINTLTGTCNATISCTGPGSATPISDTATLNVVNQTSCCGTGSQPNQTVPYTDPSSGFRCNCPDGKYFDAVANTCKVLGITTVTATYNGLTNPLVTPSCPAPLTTVSVTRDTGPSINLPVNANNPISDTSITSGANAVTYTYTLRCKGTGVNSHIESTDTDTITVPAKVKITNLQDVSSPIGSPITTTWNSTGNDCSIFARGPRTYVGASYRNNNGVNATYAHSYTMTPAARGELNSSHVGSNTLGYDIECVDSAQPIRGIAVDAFTAEIFKKPVATIAGPNASKQLTFTCTPDYNKVDIKVNGVSLTAAGYPKIYTVAPSSNFSTTLSASPNTSYLLTCSYNNYSSQDAIATGPSLTPIVNNDNLVLFGNINSYVGIADTVVTDSNSTDGKIHGLSYTAKNFDSITVTRKNSGVTVPNGSYAPVSGSASVTDGVDTAVYNNFELVIVAKKGAETKTLTLSLVKNNNPKAILTVVQNAANPNQDAVNIGIRCDNSDRYKLFKNGSLLPLSEGDYLTNNIVISDIATSTTNKTTYLLKCFSGTISGDASAEYSLPSKTPAKITAFLAQPNQIACPGGNDSATLKFMMSNTVGKVCRIIPTAISSLNNAPQKNVQMTALDTLLRSSIYKSSNSEGQKSLADVIADPNGNGVSAGQIVLSSVSKLSTDKRLFTYSTKFKLECDSKLATPQYAPTNITYSTKSVEMLSACVGQD